MAFNFGSRVAFCDCDEEQVVEHPREHVLVVLLKLLEQLRERFFLSILGCLL
jgi:hypothetical protein